MKKFMVAILLSGAFSVMCSDKHHMSSTVNQMKIVIERAIDNDKIENSDLLGEYNGFEDITFLAESLANKVCSEQDIYEINSFAFFRDARKIYCPAFKFLAAAIIDEINKCC